MTAGPLEPDLGAIRLVLDLAHGRSLVRHVGRPRPRLRSAPPTVAMFDVFDTLITRSTIGEESVHRRTATRLRERSEVGFSDDEYVLARYRAHDSAMARTDHCATLEEIHRDLVELLGWPESEWCTTASAEIQIEREMTRPVAPGREALDAARSRGLRIIFVSDMHLPSPVIRSLLDTHGCWELGDELWVSSEARERKKSGRIFIAISRWSNVDLSLAIHVGDQPLADRIAPRWVGALPVSVPNASANRYELGLARSGLPNGLGERLAGPAREVRVRSSESPDVIRSVSADVAGPTLVAYALWLLEQADRRGVKRLYFLSRDGEIIQRVTAQVARGLGMDVDLRYLYGGRMSWRLPSLDVALDREWSRFLDELFRPTIVNITGLAMRTGIGHDELVVLSGMERQRALDQEASAKLRLALEQPELRDRVRLHADGQRRLVRRYLEQEGVLTTDPIALVDVGWMGQTMRSLAALLDPSPAPLSLFFAWCGTEPLPGGQDAFMWGGERDDLWPTMPTVAAHIEMFCSGSHGGVSGYADVRGRVEPELLGERSVAANQWPLDQMQQTVFEYAELAAPHLGRSDLTSDSRLVIAELLELFREHPSADEAALWGEFPREEDPQGDSVFPIARPFTSRDLPGLVRPGPFAGRNLAWPAAAVVRTRRPMRPIVEGLLAGARAVRRLQ